ncbi:nicotinamide-nucleotide amidase [Ectothiorhodospira magna]|uniref:Nicotinamide-nucleotide amidase n=1 Tax=Ectothiorhodospira magna TaxID=867345 RepID=A0A1H9ATX5_9GAMM|nr:nicotinamide-nucleotide amidohydrolase family protein [Ectothiorhodospira magna]SEP80089.1 nicotinamide-nucleotide amidase [Ectothiorhodospira magna]
MVHGALEADLAQMARRLGEQMCHRGASLVLAESCTGGWIAKIITDVPGSSAWFDRGFVTYSNRAKTQQLDVPPTVLDTFGAVSRETVTAMATGALTHSEAHLAIAVSGIAGPGGGTLSRPVGTVWFAWAWRGQDKKLQACQHLLAGDREAIRRQAVALALQGALEP